MQHIGITAKQQTEQLRAILNEWDFIGVLPADGGPEDEYDDLNDMVTSFLSSSNNGSNPGEVELRRFLEDKIRNHFGMGAYVTIAANRVDEYSKNIFSWWQSVNK